MTTEKMTNSKALAFVIEGGYDIPADVMEKLVNIKASIDKKSATKSSKPTAKQLENARLTDVIYEALQDCEPMTIGDIIKFVPELNGLTSQKVTPMLSRSEKFTCEMIKGKNLYRVVK